MADEEKIIVRLEAEDELSGKIDNATKSIRNLNKATDNIGSSNGLSSFVSKIESGINRINNVTRHYNYSMSGFNRMVTNTVQEMGAAVYDFTTDAIDNFTEFSQQHAKVLGAMAADYDKTASSQAKFFEDAQKLKSQAMIVGTYGSTGTGSLIDISGVSQAQESLIKAGIDVNSILNTNALQDILTFAQANDMDVDSSVSTAVTLGNQFGVDPKDWGLMLDKISHTADMSIVEVSDITQSLKWASGISSGLDRSLEETLAMITVLGDFGLKGSQAGTGIQALLTRLLTGDTTVITQAQADVAPGNALEKFYEFEKLAKPDGNLLPMADVINELNATMEDMTDEEQAWFAKKLFGLYQMKSAYALMNGDDVDLNEIIKEIETQSEGTNTNKLEELLNSQYGQLESLNNMWDGIKTDVGDRLSPFVDAIRDELFTFLKNDGNYDINFDNLQDALDESCDLIEERYGSAIADAVRGLGNTTIDLAQVATKLTPELGSGLLEFFSSFFSGDWFGENGAMNDWNTMIDSMHLSAQELPEDLRGLGDAVSSAVDWFGKLVALNTASEIAELISSVLQIITIAGGAVINASGMVVVNGTTTGGGGTGGGVGGASTAGAAGASASRGLRGSTVVGNADDVARLLGESSDDIVAYLGEQASYTIDDVARYMNTSSDELIRAIGPQLDELVRAGTIAADDIARGGSTLFSQLSGLGKFLGVVGTMWQIGTTGYEAYNEFSSGDAKGGTQAIGGGAGSLGGSFAGASIGTAILPGLGTVFGAILGGLGGDFAGRDIVGELYDDFYYGSTGLGSYDTWRRQGIENDYLYESMKANAPELIAFADALRGSRVGNLSAKEWALALAHDKGMEQYDKHMSGDERIKFQSLWNEFMGDWDSWDSWEYEYNDTRTKGQKIADSVSLDDKMFIIKKGDEYYDESLDARKQGSYSVWTGTDEEYKTWLSGKQFISDGTNVKGDISNAYGLDDLSEEVRKGIVDSIPKQTTDSSINIAPYKDLEAYIKAQQSKSELDGKGSLLSKIYGDRVINQSTDGNTPSIELFNAMINGWKDSIIKKETNNQSMVNDKITLQPVFNIAPPNVTVDVTVDKSGEVTKNISILHPTQTTMLNDWYSRVSAQYGKTTK